MEGSKMSKTEYDRKAIMYSAYDTPHKHVQYKWKLNYPATQITTQQCRQTHTSVQMPPRLAEVESQVTPCSILVFLWGGKPAWGCIDPDAGISPCANRMGKHTYQAHFDGKIYQLEHICYMIM